MYRLVLAILILCSAANAADIRTGFYEGRRVVFENVGGDAIYQGDILLGRTVELEAAAPAETSSKIVESTAVSRPESLWPGGVIPYVLDSGLPAAQKDIVTQAVDYWNKNTPIRLVLRSAEADYVRFASGTSTIACSSAVGIQGGEQLIRLPKGCDVGSTIHEIGHAVGLWHEQARDDRNRFVTVLYENVDKPSAYNFDQSLSNAQDIGPYDFNSIMHYDAFGFSLDGIAPTIETVPAGIPIGQRTALSFADIAAVQRLYGVSKPGTLIATSPGALSVEVDGERVKDGTTLAWEPGSKHRVKAIAQGDSTARYIFGRWSDEGEAEHEVMASADANVLIAAYIRQYRVETEVTPAGAGRILIDPPSPDGFYTERTAVQYWVEPSNSYSFLSWSFARSPGLNGRWGRIVGPLSGSDKVTATFTAGGVTTIATNPAARTVKVDGQQKIAPVNIAADGRTHTIDIDTTQPDFTRFRFTAWSDGGAQKHNITAKSGDVYTADFVMRQSVTVQVLSNRQGGGSVAIDPSSPDDFYDEGAILRLTPTAGRGNVFLLWSGDLRGTANPGTLTVDGQKLVNAYFGPASLLPPFEVRHSATGEIDYSAPSVAPGEIVSVYGIDRDIGPSSAVGLQVANGRVTTNAGGYQVLFNGIPAPITYASARQINCVVPYSLVPGGTASVTVSTPSQRIGGGEYQVVAAQPGLFTIDGSGRKAGAILNENGSVNTPDNPAERGSVIVLYATGEGIVSPSVADGQVNTSTFPKPVLPVSVRVGGRPAKIDYAGAAPGFIAGAMQMNVRLPLGIQAGPNVPVTVVIGDEASPPGVTVAIR